LNACKRFWGVSIKKNWMHISGLDATSSRNKTRQWRLCQMINNFHLY
jgi:hypothetical protein